MKKNIFIALLLMLLGSIFLNLYQFHINTNFKKNNAYSDLYEYLPSLTISNLDNKISNKEDFTLFIGRPNCKDCSYFEPTFINMIKNENLSKKIYFFNVYWLNKNQDVYQSFKNKYNYSQVPCFIHFKNGKVENKIEWTEKGLPESVLKNWLIENRII